MNILLDSLFTKTGIQKDTFVKSVRATGHSVYVSKYRRNITDFEVGIPRDEPLLVYGSIQFVEDALKNFKCAVAFYSQRIFNCSYFMSHLPITLFVNYDAEFCPVGVYQEQRARRRHFSEWSTADAKHYFVRSDSGRKLFAGKVIPTEQMHCFDTESLSKDSIIMVGCAKHIRAEHRYFIHRKEIVSRCITHANGDVFTVPDKKISLQANIPLDKFALMVADMVDELGHMDTMYVLDIASYTEHLRVESKIGIMEFNAASTSDMHNCNITAIFSAMAECIEKENSCD